MSPWWKGRLRAQVRRGEAGPGRGNGGRGGASPMPCPAAAGGGGWWRLPARGAAEGVARPPAPLGGPGLSAAAGRGGGQGAGQGRGGAAGYGSSLPSDSTGPCLRPGPEVRVGGVLGSETTLSGAWGCPLAVR